MIILKVFCLIGLGGEGVVVVRVFLFGFFFWVFLFWFILDDLVLYVLFFCLFLLGFRSFCLWEGAGWLVFCRFFFLPLFCLQWTSTVFSHSFCLRVRTHTNFFS